MDTIGSFEAKTHLAALLDRVERGERFLITRRGKRSAELGPVGNEGEKRNRALQECRELRERLSKRGTEINAAELVREDRDRDG
jgi:prevent-host-death family protein